MDKWKLEWKVEQAFTKAQDTVDRVQKMFAVDGKLSKAIDDLGGDTAWLKDINEAFDKLHDTLEEGLFGAVSHLQEATQADLDDQRIDDAENMSRAQFVLRHGDEAGNQWDSINKGKVEEATNASVFFNAEDGGIKVSFDDDSSEWAEDAKELAEILRIHNVDASTRMMHSSDVDFASEEGFDSDDGAHEMINAALSMLELTESKSVHMYESAGEPDYGMFTARGNEAIMMIIGEAQKQGLKGVDAWKFVYGQMIALASDVRYEEALDTDVREQVFGALKAAGMVSDEDYNAYSELDTEMYYAGLTESKKYKIDGGRIYISRKDFKDVHPDFKNDTPGEERMLALDPKSGGSASFKVVFTEDLDELKLLAGLVTKLV